MRKNALAHFRRAARYGYEGNEGKARAHFRRAMHLSERSGFGGRAGGRITLLSSDSMQFVVDVDVAHMFEVMREMEVDESEPVPIPDVDGATLGKALEFCEAHASSMRPDAAWDDTYSANVPRAMLLRLVGFADKWNCELLLRVLTKRVVLIMMEEYGSVDDLRVAFNIRGDFTQEELKEAAEHSPLLLADVKREAFKWNRDYFFKLQGITFMINSRGGGGTLAYEREAQHAMSRVVANDWFYTAFLARLRCLRESSDGISRLAKGLLLMRTNVWYVMYEQLCLMDSRVFERGVARDARWQMRERMGLCTCGTPAGGQFIAHGYYDSETHQSDLEDLKFEHRYMAQRELVLRPHSGKGLLRYAQLGLIRADTCEHQGAPWNNVRGGN